MPRTPRLRRGVARVAAGLLVASALTSASSSERVVSASGPTASLSGADLTGWRVVVGDGIWTAAGERPVSEGDVATQHRGTYSELFANVQRRGVMAHNITYLPMPNVDELKMTHRASIDFRVPAVPSTTGSFRAQTIEIGLFVWDGIDTRLDHGLAMQWVLNPWVPEYGAVRVWRNTARGPRWERVGYLEPDIAWHTVSIRYRPKSGLVQLRLDQQRIDVSPTLTPKPALVGPNRGRSLPGGGRVAVARRAFVGAGPPRPVPQLVVDGERVATARARGRPLSDNTVRDRNLKR